MILYGISLALLVAFFATEDIVSRLPEHSKFRRWWRKHWVAEIPSDQEL